MNTEKTVQEKLLAAIIKHSGMDEDEIKSAGEHGADSGFNGFTYYNQTNAFYELNKSDIWLLLAEGAQESSMSLLAFIDSFKTSVIVDDEFTFSNLLAWFTLETIGQWLTSREENEVAA